MTYQAINKSGARERNNISKWQPSTLTWGVFNDSEIVQPTIIDPDAFRVWSREAFSLWESVWGVLYEEDSASRKFIKDLADKLFLVYLVDNDFTR